MRSERMVRMMLQFSQSQIVWLRKEARAIAKSNGGSRPSVSYVIRQAVEEYRRNHGNNVLTTKKGK